MKLTKEQLKQIIKEELQKEGPGDEKYDGYRTTLQRPSMEAILAKAAKLTGLNNDTKDAIILAWDGELENPGPKEYWIKKHEEYKNILNTQFPGYAPDDLERLAHEVTGNSLRMGDSLYEGKQKMKLSKEQLKQIIKEELEQIVSENKAEELEPMMENEENVHLIDQVVSVIQGTTPGLETSFKEIIKQTGMSIEQVRKIGEDNPDIFDMSDTGMQTSKQYRQGLMSSAALGGMFFEDEGHGGGLKLTKEQFTKIVAEELGKLQEEDALRKDPKLVKDGRYYWKKAELSKVHGTSYDDYIKSFDNEKLRGFVNSMGDQASGRISKMKESLEDELDQKFQDKTISLADEKQEIITTMEERMREMYADWVLEEDKVDRVIYKLQFNDEVDGRKMIGALRNYLNEISGDMGFSDLGTKVFG